MGNWWKITRLEVLLGFKDRAAVIWSLLAPFIFIAFFGIAFRESPPGPIIVAYENGDNPPFLKEIFKGFLEREKIKIAEGEKLPVLAIPDSILGKILSGEGASVEVRTKGEETTKIRTIAAKVQRVLFILAFRAKKDWLEEPPSKEEIGSLLEETGPIHLRTSLLGRAPRTPSGFERTLPAMLVMFLLFHLFTFYASLWVEDVKTGKIKRIALSPTSTRDLFFAQVAARMLWGLIQVAIIGLLGTVIFRIRWELPMFSTAALLVSYMLSITALGLLFGTLFENAEKANAVGVIASLILAALGGCWWPLEFVSKPMKITAHFLPTGLTMDAFGSFLANGRFAPFPTLNIFGLMFMSAVAMPLAVRRMRRQIIP